MVREVVTAYTAWGTGSCCCCCCCGSSCGDGSVADDDNDSNEELLWNIIVYKIFQALAHGNLRILILIQIF